MHPIKHFRTITHHKILVARYCFRIGLYRQGLTHDLSKYSPTEFWAGAKYYQGDRSPNEAERMDKGYSAAWLHHKGRNRHHLEYWVDYTGNNDCPMDGVRMPEKYVAEMICDRIAASRTYRGAAYRDEDPWKYYEGSRKHYLLHPETRALLEKLLLMLRDEGEDVTLEYIRTQVLGKR